MDRWVQGRSRLVRVLMSLWLVLALVAGAMPAYAQVQEDGPPAEQPAAGDPAEEPSPEAAAAKIEADLAAASEQGGPLDFIVVMKEQADLRPAYAIEDWSERGRFVLDALRGVAERTQRGVLNYLEARGVTYESRYIINAVVVRGASADDLHALARFDEVAHIDALGVFQLPEPAPGETQERIGNVEWNIAAIKADQVWQQFGITGQGIVVANIDSGVDYTHAALVQQYRGNQGNGNFDHNYNWWDPYGVFPNAPGDDHGHGSHTMGTMVGDDGGSNRIGVAPGARWIAAKGCTAAGWCFDAELLEAAEWILAPWDLSGENPDPDRRPHVVNNSWGGGGGDEWYLAAVEAWRAAGIFPAFSAGNTGPSCGTAGSPGDYHVSWATGAVDINNTIADFSSRGPAYDGGLKPDIAAPGVNVRSSVPGGYAAVSGTSMASPHSAGVVALIWSANSAYIGDIDATEQLLRDTAAGIADGQCGDPGPPNNVYGHGLIDALAAVGQVADTGTLAGAVTNAATGDPIAGATVVATNQDTGAQASTQTGPGGTYSISLAAGTYDVSFSAFAYQPAAVAGVVVETDQTATVNAALTPAPSATISGTVTDAETGEPLAATVTVLGTPLAPAQTDPATGAYSIQVPLGTYTVRAEAEDHRQAEQTVEVNGDVTVDFALAPVDLLVLLVDDDDNSPDVRPYYEQALSALGIPYEVYETGGSGNGPSAEAMAGFDVVVWFSGDIFSGPNAYDEQQLAAYLGEHGGSLFLSSQDYLWSMGLTEFGQTYLGVAGHTNDTRSTTITGVAGDPIGDGYGTLALSYPGSNWSDSIVADGTASTAFVGNAPGNQGIAVDKEGVFWRTVFFAMPWEAIADEAVRTEILSRSLAWLDSKPRAGFIAGTVTDAETGEPLAGASVTITGPEGTFQVTTSGNGTYTQAVPVGIYDVTAARDLYVPVTQPGVAVAEGATTTVDFALELMPLPRIGVEPGEIAASALVGRPVTAVLTVTNTGDEGTTLQFEVKESAATPAAAAGRGEVQAITPRHRGWKVKGFDPDARTTRGIYTGDDQIAWTGMAAAGDIIKSWPTGLTLPWGVGFDGDVLLSNPAAGGGDDHNHRFTVDGRFISKFPTPWIGSWAGDMDYDPGRGWMYQVNVGGDNCIYALDPQTGAVMDTICGSPWDAVSQRGVAYRPDNDTLYVGGWNTDTVYHIKGLSWDNPGEVLDTWAFAEGISGLAWNPAANLLWVATNSADDAIYGVLPDEGWQIVHQLPHPDPGFNGGGLSMDAAGNLWLVSQGSLRAYLIDSGVPAFTDVPWLRVEPTSGSLGAGQSLELTVTLDAAGLLPGTYSASIILNTNDPFRDRVAVPVTFTVEPYVVRVNVGGGAYVDSQGNTWHADHAYGTGSEPYAWGYVGGNAHSTPQPVAGTADPTLYQSQRMGISEFRFDLPAPGWYEVTLHFAELQINQPNLRVFGVRVEDGMDERAAIRAAVEALSASPPDAAGALNILRSAALAHYDIYHTVGRYHADTYTVLVNVTDGQLNVVFEAAHRSKEPVLNAIEIRTLNRGLED